ncbi:Fatty acyl-CoA elongase/Polyunsaturated fatty acid specific elongation enzyme [Ceraceosorus bombacis]|uniref:Elongation of fatty acids protein n=1 Tax=Ceraceosorus bombacis TaxID=401625 RepID=A0A0P1BDV6_9BASI|nr:Fatty acyl-CoA elongase/Polyunsaturated fatty acid specific elongation enzyme [Ceraceosorus bombacis]
MTLRNAVLSVVPWTVRDATPTAWLQWTPYETPLSNPTSAAAWILFWLAGIFTGRAYMRSKAPFGKSLKWPFFAHNVLLSAGSGLLLALVLEEILPIWKGHGFFYAICDKGAFTSKLETYYIINYYFKYYELIDTVFLVLKKKPLTTLHVYHHSATALLCFSQLYGQTSVQWVVISLNLFVHLIMRLVTIAQITQFVIDLIIVYFASWQHYAWKWNFRALTCGDCAGREYAAWAGMAVLTSYLLLFVDFYKRSYAPKRRATRDGTSSPRNAEKGPATGRDASVQNASRTASAGDWKK